MRFLLHGTPPPPPDTQAALTKHEQTAHQISELAGIADSPEEAAQSPATLLPLLEKKQWNLLTTDTNFIHAIYDKKLEFKGIIIFLQGESATAETDPKSTPIARRFDRYKRLTPRRLYTITPSRVKIRQLPGPP